MLNKSVKIKNEGNQIKRVNNKLNKVNYLYRTKIISGGIKVERKE